MCDDQHEQVEQTETTDVQKKTLSKAFVLHVETNFFFHKYQLELEFR